MTATRRRETSDTRHVLLGLMLVLAVGAVAVVSYRANRGLPLQSHYRLSVDVPDAARLAVNSAVRIGGVRVGQVDRVTAQRGPAGGVPFARLALRLEASAGPLPTDTRVHVRTGSPLGGTFVELMPGASAAGVRDGGRLGVANARGSVQVADLLEIFDRSTRRGVRKILADAGPGIAGRGDDLNRTVRDLARFVGPAERVLGVTAAPWTRLARFLQGYERTVAELSPVSDELASLMGGSARTFAALSADPQRLDDALVRAAPAEAATGRALDAVDPSLVRLTAIARRLRPGVARLLATLRDLTATLRVARPPLRQLRPVGKRLEAALRETDRLARAPATAGVLRKLTALMPPLDRLFSAVTPAQTQCNLYGVFMENAVSVLGTTGTREGSFELASVSTLGADNELFQNAEPSPNLNVNATPNLGADECESGNETYDAKGRRGNPAGLQYNQWRETVQPAGARAKAQAAGLYDSPGEDGR